VVLPPKLFVEPPEYGVTPVCNRANWSQLLPLSGILWIVCWFTRLPRVEVLVSISGASPVTSTVCVTSPTRNVKSTTAARPTVMVMPLRSSVWKPADCPSTW